MELYHSDGPASRPTSVSNSSTAPPSDDDIEAVIQMATSARPSPAIAPSKDTRTQLFVGNLPYRVRWQDLKDLFRKAGTVLRADVSLGPDNRSRGYGTVLLATAEDAGRAIDMFNGYSWQTRILEVRPDRLPPADFDNPLGQAVVVPSPIPTKYSVYEEMNELSTMLQQQHGHNSPRVNPHSNTSQSRNLFVGNLPFHCQWQDLKDLFRQAGTIIRADVALGPDGRSRGFGTVVFANDHDAERAVNMFNGHEYHGRVLKVHYDKFSQLGQLPLTAPASGLNSPLLASAQARPPLSQLSSLSGGYSYDILGLASDVQSPTPYDTHNLLKQRSFSPESSAYTSPRVRPPQVHPLQQTTRSSSSSTSLSTESSSSNPRSFDMESVATSLSSIAGNKHEPGATVSLPTIPTTSSITRNGPRVKSQPPSPPRTATHPHHPGPISLPPPPPLTSLPLSPGLVYLPGQSPLHHPYYQHLTPHGLPPITPSMPPFSFVPQPSPGMHPALYTFHQAHVQPQNSMYSVAHSTGSSDSTATFGDEASSTKASAGSSKGQSVPQNNDQPHVLSRPSFVGQMHPLPSPSMGFPMPLPTPPLIPAYGPYPLPTPPLHPHVTAAAQHFSPMSPGAFWGGGAVNPFINPAVGAPVRRGFMGTPGDVITGKQSSGLANAAPGSEKDRSNSQQPQPSGYFDLGYFPPVTTSDMRGVADEIMKPKSTTTVEDAESALGTDIEKDDKGPSAYTNSRAYSTSGIERPVKLSRSGGSDPASTITFASIARVKRDE